MQLVFRRTLLHLLDESPGVLFNIGKALFDLLLDEFVLIFFYEMSFKVGHIN